MKVLLKRRCDVAGWVASGSDEFEAKWEDGDIVLAVEPGVVVALDRNGDSNNRRKYNGL